METQITPRFLESKKSKAGKVYFQLETHEGEKYTIHEQDIANNLSANFGKSVIVDVQISGDWKNIRKFIRTGNIEAEKVLSQPVQQNTNRPAEGYKFKDATMLTAYAKDVFVARLVIKPNPTKEECEDLMQHCGALILELYNDILSAI